MKGAFGKRTYSYVAHLLVGGKHDKMINKSYICETTPRLSCWQPRNHSLDGPDESLLRAGSGPFRPTLKVDRLLGAGQWLGQSCPRACPVHGSRCDDSPDPWLIDGTGHHRCCPLQFPSTSHTALTTSRSKSVSASSTCLRSHVELPTLSLTISSSSVPICVGSFQ